MPVRFRGRLWSLCIGNGLAISKNQYALCLQRARDLLEVEGAVDREGTTGAGGGDDEANTRRVEASARRRQELVEFRDAARLEMQHVLPTLKLFQKGGVMHQDLLDLLLAWAVHNTDHDRQRQLPGYVSDPSSLPKHSDHLAHSRDDSREDSRTPRACCSSTCRHRKRLSPCRT